MKTILVIHVCKKVKISMIGCELLKAEDPVIKCDIRANINMATLAYTGFCQGRCFAVWSWCRKIQKQPLPLNNPPPPKKKILLLIKVNLSNGKNHPWNYQRLLTVFNALDYAPV